MRYDKFREERAAGKQKVTEVKKAPKFANPYARPALIKCFKCNQTSYRSSDCLLSKAIHLAEREKEGDDEVCCEFDGYRDEDEAYEEDDDEGRNYVVKKLMLMPKQKESNQRHQLFWTRCTINGKLVKLIIDSGSCDNIISRKAMKLLGLNRETPKSLYYWGSRPQRKLRLRKDVKFPFL